MQLLLPSPNAAIEITSVNEMLYIQYTVYSLSLKP